MNPTLIKGTWNLNDKEKEDREFKCLICKLEGKVQ